MIGKLAGAALLTCSCGMWCTKQISRWRGQILLARELGAALERMEGMIRWQNLTMPQILARERRRKPCGVYFEKLAAAMESGSGLPLCWTAFWNSAEYGELGAILSGVELNGDARQIMGSLHMTAQLLYRKSDQWQREQQQRERLCITTSVAVTAITAIILI